MGRRLQSSGTSFQELLDHEREIRARLLLRHTSVSVDRIGRALGYRDCTVFGRAFRRWTGLLPGEFRAQSGQPPSAIASPTSATPPVRNTSPATAGFAMV
jgi:AraC-like DNA-binding protein